MINDIETQRAEHKAWIQMFEKMVKLTGLTKAELNQKRFRPLFAEIEQWGYFEHLRRNEQNDHEQSGLFLKKVKQ